MTFPLPPPIGPLQGMYELAAELGMLDGPTMLRVGTAAADAGAIRDRGKEGHPSPMRLGHFNRPEQNNRGGAGGANVGRMSLRRMRRTMRLQGLRHAPIKRRH